VKLRGTIGGLLDLNEHAQFKFPRSRRRKRPTVIPAEPERDAADREYDAALAVFRAIANQVR
jgi:hypothetical protein